MVLFPVELFITAWPSEILLRMVSVHMSSSFDIKMIEYLFIFQFEDIRWNIYDSPWIKKNMSKDVIFFIHRTENPIVIAIPGLLPSMSLNYFAQVCFR